MVPTVQRRSSDDAPDRDEAKIFLFTFTLKGKVEAKNERARKLLKGDTRKFRVRDFSKHTEGRTRRVKNTPVTAVDEADSVDPLGLGDFN